MPHRLEFIEQGLTGDQLKLSLLPGDQDWQSRLTTQKYANPKIGVYDNMQHSLLDTLPSNCVYLCLYICI